MRRWILSITAFLFVAGLYAADTNALPAPISGFADEGTFALFKNEARIGTITYKLAENGQYNRRFVLSMAGQEVTFDFEVTPDDKGYWKDMLIVAPTDSVTVTRKGMKAEYKVLSKDTSVSADLTPGHILYDNYGPAFESLMIRAYDKKKGGEQTFSRFLVPSMCMDVTLERKDNVTRKVAGEDISFEIYHLTIAGIGVDIWTDPDGRIYLMDVPVQYAAFVREGYEDLLKKEAETGESVLSKADYTFRRETVMVPMRDGIKLATDLYIPEGDGTQWPVILIRTPYKKDMQELDGDFWARRGYATAIQDCRGRFGSEGIWEPFIHEAEDGYDAVEWLAAQPWSTGKVGMIGGSYVGWVQLWAASLKPEHLTTIIPNVAPPDPFYNIPYEYGTFFILGSIWWAEILETEATADLSGKIISRISDRKYEEILKKLPVVDLDVDIFGKANPYWRKWIQHNTNDGYWEKANFMEKLKDLEIPVFLQSGWFDGDGIGSKLNYLALKESKSPCIKLVLGPWGHTAQSSSRLGDYEFGDSAAMDLQTLYIRWFDRWLKGVENGIDTEPKVQMFAMFSNQWVTGDTYPLEETTMTKLYLSSRNGANTSRGDGRLVLNQDIRGKEYDSYTYNPKDPTPWPEFYYKSKEDIEEEKKGTLDVEERKARAKAFHNKVTDSRKDILVYQTEPLKKPLTVVGPMSAVLYASSTAVDTDWFVTIIDVNEEGEILELARGTLRARFRNSTGKAEFLEKKKIYPFTIDLWQTGITFEKGHRIRVEVSSALFPAFSRNLNTGGHNEMDTDMVKARQRIYHSSEYPSHVLLPVVELDLPESDEPAESETSEP
ncbi:MAG TPA: CocE/NonD family hydrolase [Thermoanaerobaculia bacterium]|nr:CocE/NonD family hydrolase [Thermoanaerobaculia bacterium]HUM29993.1 CocE/NonD family hydrolase [Thermoanaerobaculia bacterium]HXK68318.1 CocE/NonD family hydrolase [Thermoanaerobaculia bacterium]